MEDATYDWGRVVEELQVVFEIGEGRRRARRGGPEERVIVGEKGEEDAKEEGRCCVKISNG